jgi:hypothetical protein
VRERNRESNRGRERERERERVRERECFFLLGGIKEEEGGRRL